MWLSCYLVINMEFYGTPRILHIYVLMHIIAQGGLSILSQHFEHNQLSQQDQVGQNLPNTRINQIQLDNSTDWHLE